MMYSSSQKRPHPLRLTFILLIVTALWYLFTQSPFLFAPALALVVTVSVLFLIVRGAVRWKYPQKFDIGKEPLD